MSCKLGCKVHEGKNYTMASFYPQELEQAQTVLIPKLLQLLTATRLPGILPVF